MTPSIRKRLQRTILAAAAPLALAMHAPMAQAQAIPDNAGDPFAFGGSPTFNNPDASWSNSVFNPGSSTYPFTPFTDPACVPGSGALGCSNANFVFDNTKVVWAANASVDPGASLTPITTIDQATPFPNVNDPFTPAYAPGGDPRDGGWVFGYVFGPTDAGGSYNGAKVNYLGFFNGNGADIRVPHVVSLWDYYTGTDPIANPPTLLASVTIPAGPVSTSCAIYSDLFCWVAIAPVTLVDNQFYTVGAYGGYSPGTPAPLPLLGAAAAFGMTRKVRQRIRFGGQSA